MALNCIAGAALRTRPAALKAHSRRSTAVGVSGG